jgi:regulator of sigma E protease
MARGDEMTLLIFFVVFLAVVLIHELGHFFASKAGKVEVEEFGFGLPPRVLTMFKWRETEFTLNALPIGGFVRPKGENDPSVPGGLAAASPWTRLGVMLAGPAMNLIAGVLIYTLIFTQSGIPDVSRVVLVEVSPNSPAEQAGFLAGDLILSANGKPIESTEAIRSVIYANMDQPVVIVYERDGEQYTTTVIPSSERTVEEGATGVLLGNPVQKASLITALPLGIRVTGMYIYEIATLPARLIQGTIPAEQARFIGLKGMYDFMSQAVTRDQETRQTAAAQPAGAATESPTYYTLALIATLNISLGIFNLLPLPALDGGRIIFLLPELIFRKRVPHKVENTVHAVGIMLLLALMLYINVMDFINPVSITLP